MKEQLTTHQKQYLVSELKDMVDNYEAYELDTPYDYEAILSMLTEMLNEDWQTDVSASVVDEYLASYFKEELQV